MSQQKESYQTHYFQDILGQSCWMKFNMTQRKKAVKPFRRYNGAST